MSGPGAPDFFYREAQRLGYVARSAFKLLQMQAQYKLLKPGSSVLDLGCAPGAWLQVACQCLGPLKNGGTIVGIDLNRVSSPKYCDGRVKTLCADVMDLSMKHLLELSPKQKGFSVVLSDMCPLISGIRERDAARSMELGMHAIDLVFGADASDHSEVDDVQMEERSSSDSGVLQLGGNFVVKLLENGDMEEIKHICKLRFEKTTLYRPKASRPTSREIYLVCQGLKSPVK